MRFMGTVIYSASPFQAFLGSSGPVFIIFALGLVAIGLAIFRRRQSRGSRILTGVLGGFLVIVSFVVAVITLISASSGTMKVALNLDDKRIVEDNCGDNGETCARYVLESTTSAAAYEFDVPQYVYEKAKVHTCYDFTYYPIKGLFSNDTTSFQQIDHIALIETVDPASCQ
jgi:hypothetical protein